MKFRSVVTLFLSLFILDVSCSTDYEVPITFLHLFWTFFYKSTGRLKFLIKTHGLTNNLGGRKKRNKKNSSKLFTLFCCTAAQIPHSYTRCYFTRGNQMIAKRARAKKPLRKAAAVTKPNTSSLSSPLRKRIVFL